MIDLTLPVKCKTCTREYVCTPREDYFNATDNSNGVCWNCLLKENNLQPSQEPSGPNDEFGGLIQ